jgi:hypothetical protein
VLLAIAAGLTMTAVAAAQPVDVATRTAARELATEGAEALDRGDFSVALDRLSRANALHPAPSISVLVARCLVHLGRLVEALDRYEETARAPLPEDAPEVYRTAAREATFEAEQLRQRIPRVAIQIRSSGQIPPDVSVMLDAKDLPRALLDVDFPIDPGEHTVVVRSRKIEPVTRRVALSEKERVVLEITLNDSTPDSAPVPSPKAWSDTNTDSNRITLAWAGIAGGAAALLGAAITGKVALDKKSHLDSVCQPGCPPGSESDIDGFRTYRTVSYVAAGVSLALVGTGSYFLFVRPSPASNVGLRITPQGAALSGAF